MSGACISPACPIARGPRNRPLPSLPHRLAEAHRLALLMDFNGLLGLLVGVGRRWQLCFLAPRHRYSAAGARMQQAFTAQLRRPEAIPQPRERALVRRRCRPCRRIPRSTRRQHRHRGAAKPRAPLFTPVIAAVTSVVLVYLVTLVASVVAAGRLADMVGRKLIYCYGFFVFAVARAPPAAAPPLRACRRFLRFFRCSARGDAPGEQRRHHLSRHTAALAGTAPSASRGPRRCSRARPRPDDRGPHPRRRRMAVDLPRRRAGCARRARRGGHRHPPSTELSPRVAFDWRGLALFAPAIAAIVLSVSLESSLGWRSPIWLALVVLSIVLGVTFVRAQRGVAHPVLDLGVVHLDRLRSGARVGLSRLPHALRRALRRPLRLRAGLTSGAGMDWAALSVLPLTLGAVAPLAGRFADRPASRLVGAAGLVLVAGALLASVLAPLRTGIVVGELAMIEIGMGAFVRRRTVVRVIARRRRNGPPSSRGS